MTSVSETGNSDSVEPAESEAAVPSADEEWVGPGELEALQEADQSWTSPGFTDEVGKAMSDDDSEAGDHID